jgi:hypothetical protein
MAQITEYQNYTFEGMSIVKKYDFIDEIWQMIKEYMGVDHGIPVLFIPKFLKLTKVNMCRVSGMLICLDYHMGGANMRTYKKNRLIKNILTIFCKEFSKWPLHIRNAKILLAYNYM